MANKVTKYKVGDKVKLVGDPNSVGMKAKYYGKIGTITDASGILGYPYKVNVDGVNSGYRWCDSEFEPVDHRKIVITTDGKTTTAKLYEGNTVIKTAEAKCNPEDKFDFKVGARLAFNRLRAKYQMGAKVKVIANTCFHGSNVGDVITLTDIFRIDDDEIKWNYQEWSGYITEADIEPYVESEVKSKYKHGDKVVVTANTCHHVANVGRVITLTDNNVRGWGADHWHYKENSGYILERDFEPYTESPKPKYYNGKVVCVESNDCWFTVGKVYEFVDGIVKDNDNDERPTKATRRVNKPVVDIADDEWLKYKGIKFIPFVES